MRLANTTYYGEKIEDYRQILYVKETEIGNKEYASRWHALPIAVTDISASLVVDIEKIFQLLILGIFNTFGIGPFSSVADAYTFEDAIHCLERAACETLMLLVKVPLAPIKMALQTIYILNEPKLAHPWGISQNYWSTRSS